MRMGPQMHKKCSKQGLLILTLGLVASLWLGGSSAASTSAATSALPAAGPGSGGPATETTGQHVAPSGPVERPSGQAVPEQLELEHQTGAFSLIDWNAYRKAFNKNYSSFTQQLLRQKIFMSKQIQVFLDYAKWRLNNKAYFTSINQFSDLTRDEEHRKLSGDAGDYASDDEDDDDEILDDEQAKLLLMEALHEERDQQQQQQQDALARDRSSGEPRTASRSSSRLRAKRSLMSDLKDSFDLRELVRVPEPQAALKRDENIHIKWLVPSNNPDYQPVDGISFITAHGEHEQLATENVRDIPEDKVKEVELASSGWLKSPLSKIVDSAKNTYNWLKSNSFNDGTNKATQEETDMAQAVASSSDETPTASSKSTQNNSTDVVIIDWRDSGCVAPPMDQRECQSCYAVSSMAFLEWAFCMNQNRLLTPLSVQYLISCGPQFRLEADPSLKIQFHGCERGRSRQVMYFVKDYGLELAAHMSYLARDSNCPIEMNAPLKSKGYIRPNVKQHVRMRATTNQLELALKVGPVIVNFREPVDFLAYGGGMVGPCYQEGGHAMLIVGHGVENNTPYLLIKNSLGTDWGMNGYFKFDRKYTIECVKDFILPRVSFPSKKTQARRVKAYLAATANPGTSYNTFDLDESFNLGAGGLFSK